MTTLGRVTLAAGVLLTLLLPHLAGGQATSDAGNGFNNEHHDGAGSERNASHGE